MYGDIAAVKNKDYDTCIRYSKIIIDELAKLDASSSSLVKPRMLKWSCHSSKGEKEAAFDELYKAIMIIIQE